ncbi:MAG: AI-2E family transporter [Saprospiraceae bacterium]|nr:AI-2E family transporter [Saprospiraceae bacterium]
MKFSRSYIFIFIGLLIFGLIAYYFSDLLMYLIIGWLLAMIGQPLMRFFQKYVRIGKKWKAGPNIAAILTLFSYFILLGIIVTLFVPLVVDQAQNLTEVKRDDITEALNVPLSQANDWLKGNGLVSDTLSNQELVNKLSDFEVISTEDASLNIFGAFTSIISLAGNLLIGIFSIIFITFFFLRDNDILTNFIVLILPNIYEARIREAVEDITEMLSRYFTGILIQISLITVFVSIGLSIFGVKNALLIAIFAALINVIPYLGPLIGAAFGVLITISSNLDLSFYSEMLPLIGKVVFVFGCMQMLDNFLLQPFIFSNSVKAHPLEIFLIILVGAQLAGITGMILAIPTYTVVRVIAKIFLSKYRLVKKITEKMDLDDD